MSGRKIGVILSYVYTISQVLVNFIYIKLLLSIIGQSEYGLYQIVASLIAYLKIMQSGLSVGVSRFYCVYRASNDKKNMENTLAIAQRIFYILSVIVFFLGIVLIFVVKEFYKSSFTPMELYESQIMMGILIVNMIVDINNIVYVVSITAEEKFTFLKVMDLLSVLVQPVVVLLVLYRIPYASVIVVIQLIINIVFSSIRKRYAMKKLNTTIKYHDNDKELTRSLINFSVITILALIADQIFWKADQLILGKMYGTAIVAVYSVGCQIYTNYMHFSTSISNVFMPKISKLYGDGSDMRPLSDLFVKIGRIQFLILGMVLIVFVLFGNEFINLWVGTGYTDAYIVAVVVMLAFTIDLVQNIGLTILQVANKYGFRAKMYFIIAILNIVSTVILAKVYGSVGAAISTAVSMVIGSGFIMNYYYSRKIHLDIKQFWKQILNILIFDLPILGAGYLISFITFNSGWLEFIVHCILTVGVYGIVIYLFAMDEYEKGMINKVLNKFGLKHS